MVPAGIWQQKLSEDLLPWPTVRTWDPPNSDGEGRRRQGLSCSLLVSLITGRSMRGGTSSSRRQTSDRNGSAGDGSVAATVASWIVERARRVGSTVDIWSVPDGPRQTHGKAALAAAAAAQNSGSASSLRDLDGTRGSARARAGEAGHEEVHGGAEARRERDIGHVSVGVVSEGKLMVTCSSWKTCGMQMAAQIGQ
jgi:hypothetical protein